MHLFNGPQRENTNAQSERLRQQAGCGRWHGRVAQHLIAGSFVIKRLGAHRVDNGVAVQTECRELAQRLWVDWLVLRLQRFQVGGRAHRPRRGSVRGRSGDGEQPRVAPYGRNVDALLGRKREHLPDQVANLGREAVGQRQPPAHHATLQLTRRHCLEGQRARQHRVQRDAEGPDVHLRPLIGLPAQNLRCRVARRPVGFEEGLVGPPDNA
mmetsp:Transcript_6606/g.14414  ORF Transcript_6606/g.14414 Transcript_6606/m.14414 type:complete len:211 (+) Transcript_6606:285-917(+)